MAKISNIAIGDTLYDCVLVLKSLNKNSNGGYNAVLADKVSTISAVISAERYENSMASLVGAAICLNGIVINGTDMTPVVKIRSFTKAEQGTYDTRELFSGLGEFNISKYKAAIRETIKAIPDAGCKAFCEKALSEEMLNVLAAMPATVGYHGRYAGGALVTAAAVTKMVIQAGVQYQKWYCSMYGDLTLDWSVLVTASLIHTLGVGEYYEPEQPWNRTEIGVNRGYFSLLQSKIESVIRESGVKIDDTLLAKILNVLSSTSRRTDIKATSPEGILFRHVLMAYEDLDMLAEEMANHEVTEGENNFYSSRAKRFIAVPEAERKGA